MVKPSAIFYYLSSFISLLRKVRHPFSLLNLAVEGSRNVLFPLELRSGERFLVEGLLDAWVIKETIIDRWYEKASCQLQADWTVVDIGAALGDYAVWAGAQLTAGRIIAVEPVPASVLLLKQNLEINHVTNVDVVEIAVTGKTGTTAISQSAGSGARNSVYAHTSVPVKSITLSEFLDGYEIEVCDYLKLDCEGAEYEILFSSSPELFQRIPRICMEVHDDLTPYSRNDMVNFLEVNGYRTRLTESPVHRNLAFLYAWREEKQHDSR